MAVAPRWEMQLGASCLAIFMTVTFSGDPLSFPTNTLAVELAKNFHDKVVTLIVICGYLWMVQQCSFAVKLCDLYLPR